jgi:hypothetical protein
MVARHGALGVHTVKCHGNLLDISGAWVCVWLSLHEGKNVLVESQRVG